VSILTTIVFTTMSNLIDTIETSIAAPQAMVELEALECRNQDVVTDAALMRLRNYNSPRGDRVDDHGDDCLADGFRDA